VSTQAKPISEVIEDFEQSNSRRSRQGISHRKEDLAIPGLFRRRRTEKLAIGRRYCGSAKLGDSNPLKSADPRGRTAFTHQPARPGVDRGDVRCSGRRHPSKMACQLPQSQGKPSVSLGRAHPGTGSRSRFTLLARLAGAAGPTRPTAALP
jgi:hypothetical protein